MGGGCRTTIQINGRSHAILFVLCPVTATADNKRHASPSQRRQIHSTPKITNKPHKIIVEFHRGVW